VERAGEVGEVAVEREHGARKGGRVRDYVYGFGVK
jgi:hypothetical protein